MRQKEEERGGRERERGREIENLNICASLARICSFVITSKLGVCGLNPTCGSFVTVAIF